MKQLNLYYLGGGGGSVPDGRTVTPINDVTIWQKCAGISNPTYTTLAEILADTGILQTLMADTNAVDYLARSKEFIGNTALVPIMTSNTTPSGVCSASSNYSGRDAWYAFDNNDSTFWTVNTAGTAWLQYEFDTPKEINEITIRVYGNSTFTLQYSDDGITFADTDISATISDSTTHTYNGTSSGKHKYWRLNFTNSASHQVYSCQFGFNGICQSSDAMTYVGQNNYCANTLIADATWLSGICNSDYFNKVLNKKVPKMTSATTPSGTARADSALSGYPAWKAFDGDDATYWLGNVVKQPNQSATDRIEYEFDTPVRVYVVTIETVANMPITAYTYKVSNDGVSYPTITSGSSSFTKLVVDTESAYLRHSLEITEVNHYGGGSNCPLVVELQFYGREDV